MLRNGTGCFETLDGYDGYLVLHVSGLHKWCSVIVDDAIYEHPISGKKILIQSFYHAKRGRRQENLIHLSRRFVIGHRGQHSVV